MQVVQNQQQQRQQIQIIPVALLREIELLVLQLALGNCQCCPILLA
jgi:hypothetical protein